MADQHLRKTSGTFSPQTNNSHKHTIDDFREMLYSGKDTPIRIWFSEQPRCFDAHWHHPLEIVMPIENCYDIESCGCHYHLLAGEILIIPARKMHTVCAPVSGSRYIFQFDDSVISRIQGYAEIQARMTSCLHITKTSHPHIYNDIRGLLLQIWNEYFGAAEFRDLTIYAHLIRLLLIIGCDLNRNTNLSPLSDFYKKNEYIQKFNDVLAYIDEHYMENLTLETVAAYSGFSKYYFSRLFKQYTNCTFYEYLCFRRIKVAEELLSHPELSVTEVALLSGFSSISTFNRTFKQRKSCTPSEYRTACLGG